MTVALVQTAHDAAGVQLPDLMHRLAREMRIAAAVADDCQDAIGEDQRIDISLETAMRLQGLDLLSQQLIELGRLLDRLAAGGVDGCAPATLLDDVHLSDLKQRLAGLSTGGVRILDPELW
jgi:hypothetical protein